MTGVRIEIDDAEAKAGLVRLAEAGGDLKPALRSIGAAIIKNTQLRFEAERSPTGVPWQKSRRAQAQGGKTLQDSRRLYSSITARVVGDTTLEVGTNVVYAAVHQFGAVIRPKTKKRLAFRIPGGGFRSAASVTIPARPFLGFAQEDREDVADIIANHLRRAVRGA
jgi:phage virion morphogenesis protein